MTRPSDARPARRSPGRKAALAAAGLAAAAAGWMLSGPCGWLERGFGPGGCVGRHQFRDLVVTGDTLALDPGGRLLVAGVHYGPDRRRDDSLTARMTLVEVDPGSGRELARFDLGLSGLPDQMRLSPAGDAVAISCNALYICDLPGGNDPDASRVMLFDREGRRLWFGGVDHREAPPDANGRAFELAFSATGDVVFAHLAFDVATGAAMGAGAPPPPDPRVLEIAGAPDALDLPADFIPFPRLEAAVSPDGSRVAVLARRFSGPGGIRAVLRIFAADSGARLASHDLTEDVAPAILWHPSGKAVIVALPGAAAVDAGTELRLYAAAEEDR